jgi:hypothetical protein
MHSLKVSGECGDVLCTHAAEEIERLQALAGAAPELLAAANELLANATRFGFVGEDYSALPVIHEAVVRLSKACRKAEGG